MPCNVGFRVGGVNKSLGFFIFCCTLFLYCIYLNTALFYSFTGCVSKYNNSGIPFSVCRGTGSCLVLVVSGGSAICPRSDIWYR